MPSKSFYHFVYLCFLNACAVWQKNTFFLLPYWLLVFLKRYSETTESHQIIFMYIKELYRSTKYRFNSSDSHGREERAFHHHDTEITGRSRARPPEKRRAISRARALRGMVRKYRETYYKVFERPRSRLGTQEMEQARAVGVIGLRKRTETEEDAIGANPTITRGSPEETTREATKEPDPEARSGGCHRRNPAIPISVPPDGAHLQLRGDSSPKFGDNFAVTVFPVVQRAARPLGNGRGLAEINVMCTFINYSPFT